jgi:hypothetical protein
LKLSGNRNAPVLLLLVSFFIDDSLGIERTRWLRRRPRQLQPSFFASVFMTSMSTRAIFSSLAQAKSGKHVKHWTDMELLRILLRYDLNHSVTARVSLYLSSPSPCWNYSNQYHFRHFLRGSRDYLRHWSQNVFISQPCSYIA